MKWFRALLIVSMCGSLAAPVFGDEVLEAARRERVRKEALRKERAKSGDNSANNADGVSPTGGREPVLSNSLLKKRAGQISQVNETSSSAGIAQPGDSNDGASASSEAEQSWRAKGGAARGRVESAKTELSEHNQRINELRRSSSAIDDPNLRHQKSQELIAAEGQLEAKQQAVREAEKSLDAVREEARRAGVPASWLG